MKTDTRNQNDNKQNRLLAKASALLPEVKRRSVHPVSMDDRQLLSEGGRVLLDFGEHLVGRLRLSLGVVGAHPDAPVLLSIRFAEVPWELDEKIEAYHGWICSGWVQEEQVHVDVADLPGDLALPRRYAFRYVEIRVLAISSKFRLIVRDAEAVAETSAEEKALQPYVPEVGNDILKTTGNTDAEAADENADADPAGDAETYNARQENSAGTENSGQSSRAVMKVWPASAAVAEVTKAAGRGEKNIALTAARLHQLDRIGVHTLRDCMQRVFEDGPKRDQRLWMGDLRIEALVNYETYRNFDMVKGCLYLFAALPLPDGQVSGAVFLDPKPEADDVRMLDYSLLFVNALWDYYEQTRDKEALRDLWPTALRQISIAENRLDPDGLIRDCDELGWCFLDWTLDLNKQAGAQGVLLYALKAAIRLADACSEAGEDQFRKNTKEYLTDLYIRCRTAARKKLFDSQKELFVSGARRQVSWASQIWMILGGAVDAKEGQKILRNVAADPTALHPVTPYLYHHYIQALLNVGMRQEALEKLCSYWGGMADQGADTYWELYDPADPKASPYGGTIVNSYCHAWSCGPSYFLRKYFRQMNADGSVMPFGAAEADGGRTQVGTEEGSSVDTAWVRNEKSISGITRIRGVIFDLDGVLVSTDDYHYLAWKAIAEKLGVLFDRKFNARMRGVGRMESLEIILSQYHGPALSRADKIKLAEEKNTLYRRYLSQMTPAAVAPYVRWTLETLRERGYRLAIGSSSRNTKYILERCDLTKYFDAISDGTNITRSKPDPEVFLKAAQFLDLPPQVCVVVEDSDSGIEAAKAGGMLAAGVQNAASYPKTDWRMENMAGLVSYLGFMEEKTDTARTACADKETRIA